MRSSLDGFSGNASSSKNGSKSSASLYVQYSTSSTSPQTFELLCLPSASAWSGCQARVRCFFRGSRGMLSSPMKSALVSSSTSSIVTSKMGPLAPKSIFVSPSMYSPSGSSRENVSRQDGSSDFLIVFDLHFRRFVPVIWNRARGSLDPAPKSTALSLIARLRPRTRAMRSSLQGLSAKAGLTCAEVNYWLLDG